MEKVLRDLQLKAALDVYSRFEAPQHEKGFDDLHVVGHDWRPDEDGGGFLDFFQLGVGVNKLIVHFSYKILVEYMSFITRNTRKL